jgi:chromosome segregation protein
LRNCNERINTAAADENKYSALLDKQEKDLNITFIDYQADKKKYMQIYEKNKVLCDEINNFEIIIKDFENNFEKEKGRIFEQINRETFLKNQITEKQQTINRIREKKERLMIHIEEASNKLKVLKANLNKLELAEQENNNKLISCEKTLNAWDKQKKEINTSLQNLEQVYKQLNRDQNSLENKLISIQDMDKNFTGYSEGVRALLGSLRKGEKLKGILGVIGDLIDVPTGMELAIDVAVGKGMENILVDKADNAKYAIQFLKNNRLGRVTFLPLDILKNQPVPLKILEQISSFDGLVGIASRLVNFEPRYQKAVEYLLGRILILDNMDQGLKVFNNFRYPLRIVTLEGEVINISGAMSGGIKSSRNNSPLQRKSEEKKLKQILQELSNRVNIIILFI